MNLRKALIRRVDYFWGRRYLVVARCRIFTEVPSFVVLNLFVVYFIAFHLAFPCGHGDLDYH